MSRSGKLRLRGSAIAAALVVAALVPPTASATDPSADIWVEGTESHAPPPTGAKAEKLAVLSMREPIIETSGDITAAVVTHTVNVKVFGDDEWRSYYGTSWQSAATNRVEAADDQMFVEFGIDFVVGTTATWDSNDTARSICTILSEFAGETSYSGYDAAVGFNNNALTGGSHGCASGNDAVIDLHGSTANQLITNVWKTARHEFSHWYGAPDRYPDPNNLHTNDIMEDHYNFYNTWCTQSGYNDWGKVNSNAGKYD